METFWFIYYWLIANQATIANGAHLVRLSSLSILMVNFEVSLQMSFYAKLYSLVKIYLNWKEMFPIFLRRRTRAFRIQNF